MSKLDPGKTHARREHNHHIPMIAPLTYPAAFGDEQTVKRALWALRRSPIHYYRDNVIVCEGDPADSCSWWSAGLYEPVEHSKPVAEASLPFIFLETCLAGQTI